MRVWVWQWIELVELGGACACECVGVYHACVGLAMDMGEVLPGGMREVGMGEACVAWAWERGMR